MDERARRISDRFHAIEQALALTTDKEVAYAAFAVAWLEGIEYFCLQALYKIESFVDYPTPEDAVLVPLLHRQIRRQLLGFHEELCAHLGVSQERAIELSKHFKEVVDDICKDRG